MVEGQTDSALSSMLGRRIGPFPAYVWVMGAGAAGLLIYRLMKARQSTSSSEGNMGQGNNFSSTQTMSGSTPGGGQYSTSYSANGNGYLPGSLTWDASNIPIQPGDIYVNVPTQSNTEPTPAASTTDSGSQAPAVPQFGSTGSDGNTSLWQYAKEHGTQPELIIWATSSHYQTTQTWNDYINNGNFNAPVPQGQLVYWPIPG